LWKRKESRKIVHFPVEVLDQMKNEAHTELGESLGHNQSLSNNDILTAWLVKAMFHPNIYTAARDQTPVGVGIIFDAHRRLKSLFPLPYLHNTIDVVCVYPWITIYEIQSLSLARLALRIRTCVSETLTEEAVRNQLAWRVKKGGIPYPYNGTFVTATSLRNSGFENVDFSAALCSDSITSEGVEAKVDEAHDATGAGRMAMLFPMAVSSYPLRRVITVPCEDGEGGIWTIVAMPDVDWAKGEFGSLKEP
jgi:hypothetical protein